MRAIIGVAVTLLVLSGCGEAEDQERLTVDVRSDVCLADACQDVPVKGVELMLTLAGNKVGTSLTDDAGTASFALPEGSAQGEVQVSRTPWPGYPAEPISVPVTLSETDVHSISLRLPMLKATPAG